MARIDHAAIRTKSYEEAQRFFEDVAGVASSFLSAVVNFIIMAFILFCLMKAINKLVNLSKPEEKPAAPTTKVCPFCQSKISIKATSCPHCTSVLEENVAEEK